MTSETTLSHRIRAGGALLLLSLLGLAPVTLSAGPTMSERAAAYDNALAAFRAGKVADGELFVVGVASARAGSATEKMQAASALMRIASTLRQTGEPQLAALAAECALTQLGIAEKRLDATDDRGLAAAIKHMAGLLHEEFVGTTDTAKEFYRSAVTLDKNSAAKAALNRIENAEADSASRQAANPKG